MNRTLLNLLRSFVVFALISLILVLPSDAREYKIAVAGLVHSHAWGHLKEILEGKEAKLVGIADSTPELLDEAKKRGAADALLFGDYREMIEKTKPDIVWSFAENNRHLEIVQFCAPRKIHVMFEKPLAAKYADALRIQQLAQREGIQVMVNYQMAWWPSNYAAKAVADSGALGQVWRLRGIIGNGGPSNKGLAKYSFEVFTDPERNGAGAMVDFQCYGALWSLWYLGRPEKVYCQANHFRPELWPKVEDNSTMILSYPKGVGLFEGSWDLPRGLQDLEVFGSDGSVTLTKGESPTQQKVQLQKGRNKWKVEDVPFQPLPPERAEPIAYLVRMLESGKPLDGLVALSINVDVVEIIEAARMSAASGQAVCLPLPRPTEEQPQR
jgi:predicted dehydrogenase